MQSKMDKQIVALRKEYDGKIYDLTNQLKVKDEELNEAQAEITRLTSDLKDVTEELSETTSALETKTSALATLNASALTPGDTVNWRTLRGKAFFDYCKEKGIR